MFAYRIQLSTVSKALFLSVVNRTLRNEGEFWLKSSSMCWVIWFVRIMEVE